jgi:hypothetical protein
MIIWMFLLLLYFLAQSNYRFLYIGLLLFPEKHVGRAKLVSIVIFKDLIFRIKSEERKVILLMVRDLLKTYLAIPV